jgi:hypothetical protein
MVSMTTLGVVFAIALFSGIAVLAHFARRRVIEEPLHNARARRSAVAEFVDDLQQHRWLVIISLALLVDLNKSFRFSGGLLQSRLLIASLITMLFVGRFFLRQHARQQQANSHSRQNESTGTASQVESGHHRNALEPIAGLDVEKPTACRSLLDWRSGGTSWNANL